MYVTNLESAGGESCGEKTSKLSKLLKEKFPVPNGFVISRDAFEFFLKKNNLMERIANVLENVDVDDYRKLSEASGEIKEMFLASHFPDTLKEELLEGYDNFLIRKDIKEVGGAALDFIRAGRENIYVSVRVSPMTSPDSSFPGLFETFLNVSGQKGLFDAVKICWASLYSPRAIFYRGKKGLSSTNLGSLVIQKMIDSEKSGVAIGRGDSLVVEGSWGLGISLSYGLVCPDRYVLDSHSGEVRSKNTGKKVWTYRRDSATGRTVKECVLREKVNEQLLEEKEIAKIFELYRRVSDNMGQEQMIEWAIEGGRIYILQSRSLPEAGDVQQAPEDGEGERAEGISLSDGFSKGPARIINNTRDLERIGSGDVIATKILSPELIPFMERAGGVISEYGGLGSSVSLACREFRKPCVSEIEVSGFSDSQMLSVNGTGGFILSFGRETPETGEGVSMGKLDGVNATEVKINYDLSRSHEFGTDMNEADGVGLLTSEGMFVNQNPEYLLKTNPEELLNMFLGMESVARNVYPKTVWYRSYSHPGNEINTMMGARGVRKSLEDPDMLKCEVEAIKRMYSKGMDNIGIILSFVSSVPEFRAAKQFIPFSLKLGVEVSIPSTALEIESFCKEGLNLVSINLPELTQLTLGVDRNNPQVSHLYSESSPAVMKLIESVVRVCMHYNVEVSVTLDRYEPDAIEKLVRAGVGSISMNPEHVSEAKYLVSRTEKRILMNNLRGSSADSGDYEIVS